MLDTPHVKLKGYFYLIYSFKLGLAGNYCLFYSYTRKVAVLRAFSNSCGRLQPSASSVGPFGPTKGAAVLVDFAKNFAENCV